MNALLTKPDAISDGRYKAADFKDSRYTLAFNKLSCEDLPLEPLLAGRFVQKFQNDVAVVCMPRIEHHFLPASGEEL